MVLTMAVTRAEEWVHRCENHVLSEHPKQEVGSGMYENLIVQTASRSPYSCCRPFFPSLSTSCTCRQPRVKNG